MSTWTYRTQFSKPWCPLIYSQNMSHLHKMALPCAQNYTGRTLCAEHQVKISKMRFWIAIKLAELHKISFCSLKIILPIYPILAEFLEPIPNAVDQDYQGWNQKSFNGVSDDSLYDINDKLWKHWHDESALTPWFFFSKIVHTDSDFCYQVAKAKILF